MANFLRKLWNDKRGNALVIAGAALPLLIGSAGLATDTIQWALWKRQLQRAADSAALAGVYARVQNNSGQTANQAVTNELGRNDHTNITQVPGFPQVNFPVSAQWTNGVQVDLAIKKKLGFSALFMPTPPTIRASATAATIATGVYCVVSLIETGATGITATGNGHLDLGCGMITNSTSLTAAIATGSSTVNATPVAAVGNIGDSDNWGGAELLPFTVKQADPYADVVPDTSTCGASPPQLNVGPGGNEDRSANDGETVCFRSMSLNGPVQLADNGTYIIDGGGLSMGAQGNIRCTGCTFVLTNSSASPTATIGQVNINGGAQLNLSAPTGGPYNGILMYQDRRASPTAAGKNIINGGADSVLSGAFYFPRQQLDIKGNATMRFTCAKFVAYVVEFSGNSGVRNTCDPDDDPDAIMGRHVRLVG